MVAPVMAFSYSVCGGERGGGYFMLFGQKRTFSLNQAFSLLFVMGNHNLLLV